jgi:enamine deaminase RidA (YjgF/YER057c/UK114 family)
VRVGNTIWVSGQIPLDPRPRSWSKGDIEAQIRRGVRQPQGHRERRPARLRRRRQGHVFLTDLPTSRSVNKVMASISASPIRRAPRSASPRCRAARRSKWSASSLVIEPRRSRRCAASAMRSPSAARAGRRDHPGSAVPAAAALRGPHARGAAGRACTARAARGGRGRGAAHRGRVSRPAPDAVQIADGSGS